MKNVIFNRDVDCDYYDRRMDETYPKFFRRWNQLRIERDEFDGKMLLLFLDNGDIVSDVPADAVSIV